MFVVINVILKAKKKLSRLPRHKVITLLARLIRFGTIRWEYANRQFLFSQQ